MTAVAHTDGRKIRGDRTRRSILEAAALLASTEGLEGLSLARLADHVGMSKSGLFAHFGSKEELQLAAIAAADAIYEEAIVAPTLALDSPRERLLAVCDNYLDFISSEALPGGCFFIASSLDPAMRRGAVKAALAQTQRAWGERLTELVAEAQHAGEISASLSAEEVAFELGAMLTGADVDYVMFGERRSLDLARSAIRRRLT